MFQKNSTSEPQTSTFGWTGTVWARARAHRWAWHSMAWHRQGWIKKWISASSATTATGQVSHGVPAYLLLGVCLLCRRRVVLLQGHHLLQLANGKRQGDPRRGGHHPRRLAHVFLLLLVLGLPGQSLGFWCRGRAVGLGTTLVWDQVNGGNGDRAGRNRNVLGQDLVFFWEKKRQQERWRDRKWVRNECERES